MDQEYLEEKVITLKKLTAYQRLREVSGLVILVTAIFLVIALMSFDRADPSWSQTAWHEPIRNTAGRFGAWSADVLFSIFGIVAYILPVMLLVYCWKIFRQRHSSAELDYFTLSLRFMGFWALILSSCSLADLNFDDWGNFSSGGVLGSLISNAILPMFNYTGAILTLLFLWAIGLTLFTGWSWLTISEKTGAIVISIATFILNIFRAQRQKTVNRNNEKQQLRLAADEFNHDEFNHIEHNAVIGSMPLFTEDPEQIVEDEIAANQLTLNLEPDNNDASFNQTSPAISTIDQHVEHHLAQQTPDRISQIIHSMAVNQHSENNQPQPSVVANVDSAVILAENSAPVFDRSFDASGSELTPSEVVKPETDTFKSADPSTIDLYTIIPSTIDPSAIDPSTINFSTTEEMVKPKPTYSEPAINKPLFTPAKTKVVPELPRPNPVRIPTRRELMSYGISIPSRKENETSQTDHKPLSATLNEQQDEDKLREQFTEQQKQRYGAGYEADQGAEQVVANSLQSDVKGEQWQGQGNIATSQTITALEKTDSGIIKTTVQPEDKKQVLLYEYKDSFNPIRTTSDNVAEQSQAVVNNHAVNNPTFNNNVVEDDYVEQNTAIEIPDSSIFVVEPTTPQVTPVQQLEPVNSYRALSTPSHNPSPSTATKSVDVKPINATSIDDSLIHPFLMRNEKPLHKPTTPLPTLDLLSPPPTSVEPVDIEQLEQIARLIEERLGDYRVKADVVGILPGPVITLYELDLAPGVKAARISNLSRDLARSLSTVAVRVVEVIPGRPYVGLELPNKHRQTVYLREVLDCAKFRDVESPLAIVLGKDISGEPVIADLAKMPHVLVAGTTGSGKSVGVNAMILSMLYKATPDEVRFIMIDPKMLELSVYEGIPHLLTEVVTDMKDAANALRWCVGEMERRYKLMSALGVRNLAGYNERVEQAINMGRPVPDPFWKPTDSMDLNCPTLEKLPYIVVIVDEFADLMMAVGKKVEELIARLAQKARAAGIHLVLATQRPSVDVITGLIKANIPTRIAFTVSSKIDSRTILDQSGAESLLGMGDMLYMAPNSSTPIRVHGAFVRDEEVHAVVQDWKARGKPQYIESITKTTEEGDNGFNLDSEEELDPLFDQAVAFVVEKRKPSISGVQRQFRIGYNRAARIIEQMEAQGIVSPPGNNGNREVLAPPLHD